MTLDLLQRGLFDALQVDAAIGRAVGGLQARPYHRTRSAISMTDSIAAETARVHSRPLATADPDLLDVCHAEGIFAVALPGSNGSIWTAPDA